jgi:hypothetical protein
VGFAAITEKTGFRIRGGDNLPPLMHFSYPFMISGSCGCDK